MTNSKLSHEEKELLQAYENGEYVSDLTEERKAQLSDAAQAASKKDKRMNVRISSRDLKALQRRALQEGLPYQTLVSSVLHKYLSGGLKDVSADKSMQPNADASTD